MTDESTSEPRARTGTAFIGVAAFGALLGVVFFPVLFSGVAAFDDEGAFLVTLRAFLKHGSLYDHTHGAYGPFYYSFLGAIYRVTGQTPTIFNGRLLTLALTTLSAGVFAATVWRVTRSLTFALLCELATFSLLIRLSPNVSTHPGSLIVLLVAVLIYGLASYALEQRAAFLVVVGVAIGALAMTKINVGIFAAAAVAIAFVVGNRQFTKSMRTITAAAGLLLPFLLMYQKLYELRMAQFALLVSLGLLMTYAPMHVDVISLPRRALVTVASAALVPIVASSIWPLASGTSVTTLVRGVLIRPLSQADHLSNAPVVDLEWLALVITVCVVYAALTHREDNGPRVFGSSWLPNAALAVASVYVLGLGMLGDVLTNFLAWLPAIALLPALAWISAAPPKVRLVLRFLVPVAILQILHAYPVPGAQRAWGLVAFCVPCVIALAVATKRLTMWREASRGVRTLAVGTLGVVLVLGGGLWPLDAWHTYLDETPLRLPGTRLVRVDPSQALGLQRLTDVIKKQCGTFYSAPGLDSLYIYTGIPAPTGLLANWPGVLDDKEQRELVGQLAQAESKGKRVCIVRDLYRQQEWLASSYGKGILGRALAPYKARLAVVGRYSVSVRGSPHRPSS